MSRHWNAENRQLLKEGKIKGFFAGPDESFPIAGPEDITHAFETLHYAKPSEQGEIRARIISGAKEHGWESHIPEDEVAKADHPTFTPGQQVRNNYGKVGTVVSHQGVSVAVQHGDGVAQHYHPTKLHPVQSVAKAMPGTTGMAGAPRTPQAAAYNSARIQAEAHAHAAHNASRAAVTTSTPEAHAAAAQAHNVAAQSHFTARTKAAAAGDQGAVAKHNQAMMQHNQQKAYHASMQGGGEGGVRPAWNHQAVAKSEAEPPEAMTPEEVLKAQVHAHTRHLKSGKSVQVRDYQTARQVAHQNSAKAHEASGASTVNHQAAAAAHRHAAQAHLAAEELGHRTEAAVHRTMATIHNQSAQLHESMIPQKGADTGGDGQHMPEHLQDLEKHPDFAGFGYLGHEGRTPATDKALAEAANKHGLTKHELAAIALGRAGRYIGDTIPEAVEKHHGKKKLEQMNEAYGRGEIKDDDYNSTFRKMQDEVPHDKMVQHFQKEIAYHMTGKASRHSGVKEYAKDLAEREAEAKSGKKGKA